ncbi:TPA: DMT family transporter [Pseudomonas aeruginosa]|nr:DMT family transporter [Pseudomonas aeruginosa]
MFSAKADRQLTITTADWALVFIAMIWGSSYPAVKFVLSYSDVLLFIFIRFSMTALLMLPIFLARNQGGTWQTLRIGSILGGLLFAIFWCETTGVQKTSAANAAFFISLCVLFTPLMEALIAKSLPSTRLILACGFTCVGAGMMGTNQNFQFQLNTGDLFILAAAFLRALGVVVTKHLTKDSLLDSGAITAIQMTMVALISGVWLYSTKSSLELPTYYPFWMATLYLVLFCTLLAFYLQTHLVRLTSPTRVTLIMGAEPIFGAFFAIVLLKEQFTYFQALGGMLIVLSTYLGMQAHNRSHRAINHE